MIHEDGCLGRELIKENGILKLTYCESCGRYVFSPKDCEHELVPVAFTISNGSIQVRRVCKKCFYKEPNPLKQSDFILSRLPKRNLEEFNAFFEEEEQLSKEGLSELIFSLTQENKKFRDGQLNEYYNTPAWKEKRDAVLQRDGYTCQRCGLEATDVHHLEYINFRNEYLYQLVSLCNECHFGVYHPERKPINENKLADNPPF